MKLNLFGYFDQITLLLVSIYVISDEVRLNINVTNIVWVQNYKGGEVNAARVFWFGCCEWGEPVVLLFRPFQQYC